MKLIDPRNISNLILKLYVFIGVISLTMDKTDTPCSKSNGKENEFEYYFLIVGRYMNNFIANNFFNSLHERALFLHTLKGNNSYKNL